MCAKANAQVQMDVIPLTYSIDEENYMQLTC